MADSFLRLFDEPALADYRLILVHRRGYGESTDYEGVIPLALQAEDLASLLRQLNVEQAHVIGHSGGVPPVVALASMYPDRVQSLMRLEGGGPPIAGAPPPSQANMEGFARVNEAMQQALQMEPAQQARALFQGLVGDGWEAEVTKYFPGAIEQVAADFAMTVTQDLPGLQVPVDAEFYESITQPIASVFSENAPYLDALQPREMRQTWEVSPQTEFRFLPGMGHEMMIVHPEPVAELIADWLAENPIE